MTQKFHVTDDGAVMPCEAEIKSCKFLKRENIRHFDNELDANTMSTKMLSNTYSPFGSTRKTKRNKPKSYDAFNMDISTSLLINNTPKVGALPSGKAFEDFERVLQQISGETDWYYEKVA